MAQTNNPNQSKKGPGNQQGQGNRGGQPNSGANSGNRGRNRSGNSQARRVGNAAAGGGNVHVQTPEEQRARLRQQLGQRVMTHVMDRVRVKLGTTSNPVDPAILRQQVTTLTADFVRAGGDADQLKDTIALLDIDDAGVDMITGFLANANKGLEADERMFFGEAHSSTQKIIDDLTKTGRARIVGPDGKLYDMDLIAIDKNDTVDAMPDCLGTEVKQRIAANQPFDLAGTYAVGGDVPLLPNILHGEIVAESELPKIKRALDGEAGKQYDAVGGAVYTFNPIAADDSRFTPPETGAYLVEILNGDRIALPTTTWYANHRSLQRNLQQSAQSTSGATSPQTATAPTAPTESKQPALKVTPVKGSGQPKRPVPKPGSTPPAPVPPAPKPGPAAPKSPEATPPPVQPSAPEKGARREIYKTVRDYFAYGLPRSVVGAGLDGIKSALGELQELGSGEDSFGKVEGQFSTLLALSDGMGGQTSGADASRLTIEAFLDEVGAVEAWDGASVDDVVNEALTAMDRRIRAARKKVSEFNETLFASYYIENYVLTGDDEADARHRAEARKRWMDSAAGATVVGAEIVGDNLVYSSIGDSSIFVVRNGQLILVAGDRGGHGHFLYNSIGGDGEKTGFIRMPVDIWTKIQDDGLDRWIRREQAKLPGAEDLILEYSKYDDLGVFKLQDGDRVVLCSDGIMGDREEQVLTDAQIVAAAGSGSTVEATKRLIEIAEKVDDRTVVMADVRLQ